MCEVAAPSLPALPRIAPSAASAFCASNAGYLALCPWRSEASSAPWPRSDLGRPQDLLRRHCGGLGSGSVFKFQCLHRVAQHVRARHLGFDELLVPGVAGNDLAADCPDQDGNRGGAEYQVQAAVFPGQFRLIGAARVDLDGFRAAARKVAQEAVGATPNR